MFTLTRNPRASITPVAGERVGSRLVNRVQSHFISLRITGTLTIAGGAATAIRNRGSVAACFDEIGINENGTDRVLARGAALRMLAEGSAPSALTAKRVTGTAAAAYELEEVVRLYFAHPFAVNPRETAFIENDPRQVLEVFVKQATDAAGRLVEVGGAVTAALTNLRVEVTQAYDATEKSLPEYIPTIRQLLVDVPSANSQQVEYLKTTKLLRAVVISQETTTVGEVDDIINKVALKGDFRDIIGPSPESFDQILLDSEYDFGGAVVASNRSHLLLNFQQHGRLSNVINPAQDANLRFEFDCAPSASAGSSKIRITLVELERVAGLTNPASTIPA